MLDARNIYRKVTRRIFDFSPEQQKNISAIVWLYRGQSERFLALVESYLDQAIDQGQTTATLLSAFEKTLDKLIGFVEPFATEERDPDPLSQTWAELANTKAKLSSDVESFVAEIEARAGDWEQKGNATTRDNGSLHTARESLHDMADRCSEFAKQIDLAARLAGRVVDVAVRELDARKSDLWTNTDINATRSTLGDSRTRSRRSTEPSPEFRAPADWLQDRFPDAELHDVEGLVKLVDRAEIEAHDWSLTPGRYVGVAPEEVDEGFDFEETMREIHVELDELNGEAMELAAAIARNLTSWWRNAARLHTGRYPHAQTRTRPARKKASPWSYTCCVVFRHNWSAQ